jgi:hypothetical protein
MSTAGIIIFVVIFILIIVLVVWLVFFRNQSVNLVTIGRPFGNIVSIPTFKIKQILSGAQVYFTIAVPQFPVGFSYMSPCLSEICADSLLWSFYPDPTDSFLTLRHIKSGLFVSTPPQLQNGLTVVVTNGKFPDFPIISVAKVPVSDAQFYLQVGSSTFGLSYDRTVEFVTVILQPFADNPNSVFYLE